MNQILRRQTSRSHYGSKVPAVTVTVFKYRNKIGKLKLEKLYGNVLSTSQADIMIWDFVWLTLTEFYVRTDWYIVLYTGLINGYLVWNRQNRSSAHSLKPLVFFIMLFDILTWTLFFNLVYLSCFVYSDCDSLYCTLWWVFYLLFLIKISIIITKIWL